MPVFEYRCQECGKVYDVLHKVREKVEDVVCPDCQSTRWTKMISAPALAGGEKSSAANQDSGTCCCGGACGVN